MAGGGVNKPSSGKKGIGKRVTGKTMDKYASQGFTINEDRYANQLQHQDAQDSVFRAPVTGGRADWIEGDKDDTEFMIRKQLGTQTAVGQQMMPDKYVDWHKRRLDKLYDFELTKLAENLIDDKNPASQAAVWDMFPDLIDGPQKKHMEVLALQEMLYTILRNGCIKGPDDNHVIFRVCSLDFEIPELPAWDPYGVVLSNIDKYKSFFEEGRKRALFNPTNYGVVWWGEAKESDSAAKRDKRKSQIQIKMRILRTVYPGFRDATDDVVLKQILRISEFSRRLPNDAIWDDTTFNGNVPVLPNRVRNDLAPAHADAGFLVELADLKAVIA